MRQVASEPRASCTLQWWRTHIGGVMEWSEEEMAELFVAWSRAGESAPLGGVQEQARAVGSRAVELMAARGGTMTAEELARALERLTSMMAGDRAIARFKIADHIAALGARAAVLEDERKRWTKHRNELAEQRNNARQEGTESMRAECLRIVAEEMGMDGWAKSALHRRIKERMEGANSCRSG